MAKKQTSFERVMAVIEQKFAQEHGTVIGAKAWLARGLGVTKQNIHNIQRRGYFPGGYLAKISKFTGIPIATLQGDITDEVIGLSRKWRLSMRETEVALIRAGLESLERK